MIMIDIPRGCVAEVKGKVDWALTLWAFTLIMEWVQHNGPGSGFV